MSEVKEGQYVTVRGYAGYFIAESVLGFTDNKPVLIRSVDHTGEISTEISRWVDHSDCTLYAHSRDGYISKREMESEGVKPQKSHELIGKVVKIFGHDRPYLIESYNPASHKLIGKMVKSSGSLSSFPSATRESYCTAVADSLEIYRESLKPDPVEAPVVTPAVPEKTHTPRFTQSEALVGYEIPKGILKKSEDLPTAFMEATQICLGIERPYRTAIIQESTDSSIKSNQEGNIMNSSANRSVVSVVLLDPSKGIEDADSIVKDCGQHVMSGGQQNLVQEILMDPKLDILGAIAAHNKVRAGIVNLDIMERTGNKVFLQPVKINDLQWSIK